MLIQQLDIPLVIYYLKYVCSPVVSFYILKMKNWFAFRFRGNGNEKKYARQLRYISRIILFPRYITALLLIDLFTPVVSSYLPYQTWTPRLLAITLVASKKKKSAVER